MTTAPALAVVKVGDTIWTSMFGRPASESVVTAVGRKWVTAGGTQFSIEDGTMKGAYTGYAQTAEQHTYSTTRSDLLRRLGDRGVQFGLSARGFTNEHLEQILAIALDAKGNR